MGNQQGIKVLFSETQRFTQWWIWVLVLVIVALQWWSFIQQIIFKVPFGDNPAPDWMVIAIMLLFGIGLPWLIFSVRLETSVTNEAIFVRFFPFHRIPRMIPLDGIKEYGARKYNPILEYGGWGIKFGRGGQAINVSSNMGLQLEFNNGKRLLIGSGKAGQLEAAVTEAFNLSASNR